MKSLSLLFFTFILISCGTTLRERITEHAVTRISYWPSENLTLPLEKKVLPVPREILEFVSLDNEYKGYKQRPREVLLTKKQKLDIKNALKEIPEAVSRVVRDKLLAIYFVEDLGGSGFAEGVTDKDGKIVASFILFDIAVLNRKANSWASWKENTPFKSNSPYRVEAIIEEEANNNRKNAIQYIVLHELGHVASIGAKIHPCWKNWIAEGEKFEDFEFMNLSWREDKKEGLKSIHDSVFLERSEIQYYRAENKRFAADRMKSIYKKLKRRISYPCMQQLTLLDDFAEAFVTYVHTVMMKRPFKINIIKNDEVINSFTSRWDQPRFKRKRLLLEKFFSI